MLKRLTLPALILAGTVALLGAPDSRIAAAECGGPGEILCKEHQDCAWIMFWRGCTTSYDYWQEDGGVGEDPV